MTTMTCTQLGGPCELQLRGESADDVIKAQDAHLREAVAAGDTTHEPARDAMEGRWRHPEESLDWYRGVQRTFGGLPED